MTHQLLEGRGTTKIRKREGRPVAYGPSPGDQLAVEYPDVASACQPNLVERVVNTPLTKLLGCLFAIDPAKLIGLREDCWGRIGARC